MRWFTQRRIQWFARRHPSHSAPVALKYDRIYILPGGFGYAFTLTAVLILIGAINYQLSLAYLFAFMLLGTGHAAMLRTFGNLLKLRLQLFDGQPVFAGETAHFPLHLLNPGSRTKRAIRFAFQTETSPASPPGECQVLEHEIQLLIPLQSQQRGWLNAPVLLISSDYPTGLCRAWSYLNSPARCLIWPQPEINPPPWLLFNGPGDVPQTGRGEEDFAGLRPYTPGDSLRRIAWKKAAHADTLPVKYFDSKGISPQVFCWDMLGGLETEARLSRLTAWILVAEQLGMPYGLELPYLHIDAATGTAHQVECLNALALFK